MSVAGRLAKGALVVTEVVLGVGEAIGRLLRRPAPLPPRVDVDPLPSAESTDDAYARLQRLQREYRAKRGPDHGDE